VRFSFFLAVLETVQPESFFAGAVVPWAGSANPPDPGYQRDPRRRKGIAFPGAKGYGLASCTFGVNRRCLNMAADVLTRYMKGGMRERLLEVAGTIVHHVWMEVSHGSYETGFC
jgi:hypothetical protein